MDDNVVMSIEEQTEVVEYARKNYKDFDVNGYNKWKKALDELNNVPECIYKIKERIVVKEKLEDAPQEPILRDQIGYMIEGGNLHPHIDKNYNGLIHVRYNVYVQIPYEGGMPVYGKHMIDVREREYTVCRSGLDLHFTDVVKGDRERIILSFGFLLPYERAINIRYKFTSIL